MAFAHNVWHVNASGRLYGGSEIWTMGFWLGQDSADAGIPTVTYANLIHNRVKTFFGHANSHISWAAVLDTVKIQHWHADGHMITGDTVFSTGIAAQAGAETRNVVPQIALAVSFRNGLARGPGANGRMFVPMFNCIPTATGHVESADINGIIGTAKTMFDGIKTDLTTTGNHLINASKGGTNPVTAPVNVSITSLRVGDVVDTIQRRRNALRESYTLSALA